MKRARAKGSSAKDARVADRLAERGLVKENTIVRSIASGRIARLGDTMKHIRSIWAATALFALPACAGQTAPEPDPKAQQSAQTAAAVDAYFAGLGANDMSEVPFAANAVLTNPLLPEPVQGGDKIKEVITGAIQTLEEARIERRIVDGANACVVFDYVDASGLVVDIVDCFVVEDGEITDLQLYYDARLFLAAAE